MISREKMQMASMIFGIVSLIAILMGFSMPFGAIGLILVLMSRNGSPMPPKAVIGLVTSLIGLIFGIMILISSLIIVSNVGYDRLLKEFEQYSEYGYDGTEYSLDSLLGGEQW